MQSRGAAVCEESCVLQWDGCERRSQTGTASVLCLALPGRHPTGGGGFSFPSLGPFGLVTIPDPHYLSFFWACPFLNIVACNSGVYFGIWPLDLRGKNMTNIARLQKKDRKKKNMAKLSTKIQLGENRWFLLCLYFFPLRPCYICYTFTDSVLGKIWQEGK